MLNELNKQENSKQNKIRINGRTVIKTHITETVDQMSRMFLDRLLHWEFVIMNN